VGEISAGCRVSPRHRRAPSCAAVRPPIQPLSRGPGGGQAPHLPGRLAAKDRFLAMPSVEEVLKGGTVTDELLLLIGAEVRTGSDQPVSYPAATPRSAVRAPATAGRDPMRPESLARADGPIRLDRAPLGSAALRRWQQRAACQGSGDSFFFPPEAERTVARALRIARAKAICAGCPALVECRDYALRAGEPFGVWGGLSEEERGHPVPLRVARDAGGLKTRHRTA